MVASNLMTVNEFKRHLIERGIQSIRDNETRPERIKGGIAGFELCQSLNTPEQFEATLRERHAHETQMICNDRRKGYWEYRYATLQIEFVWERMKIVWKLPGAYSARAYIDCGTIIGVSGS